MIEKEEKRSNMKYDIIVRLRPDTLFVVPMPEISLRTTRKGILDIRGFGAGGEDIFNVGRRKEMGRFMNRVYDINKIFLDRRFVNAVGLGRYTAETYSVFWWWWENYARDSKKYENLNKAPITQYSKENIYMWPHI
jgi:hypothetical protein